MEALANRRGLNSPTNLVRVALTGSESTGKSTLARELADHYGAELSPEFLRDYAVTKGSTLAFADTEPTALGQIAIEDEHAISATRAVHPAKLLVQDTDLLSTAVYAHHYFGQCPEWIEQTARERRPDLYLLLEIDVPWVRDDVRDQESNREEMQRRFRAAVASSGSPYVVVQGDWDERRRVAIDAIDGLLESRLKSRA